MQDQSRTAPAPSPRAAAALTTADVLAEALSALGVEHAFGVSGGAQALLWAAFSRRLDVTHFRHESGAAFAAAEAHFASGKPVAVFVTTGPGITNALTGAIAARTEGAKVVLVSAYSSAAHRGRGGIQETSPLTFPTAGLFEPGQWFDDAAIVETPAQLPQMLRRIAAGLARPGGYLAHLSVPTAIQGATLDAPMPRLDATHASRGPDRRLVRRATDLLAEGPFAVWAGFGALGASSALLAFAERTQAPVLCSPRAKGVVPEDHPLFVGVTGMGGHAGAASAFMREHAPRTVLVLGTRLGEPTSFWNPAFVPANGFVHVDVDPRVPGVAYPSAPVMAVEAEVGAFLDALSEAWPTASARDRVSLERPHPRPPEPSDNEGRVRPDALMGAIQRTVVEGSDAVVLAESGNAFTWATSHLRFDRPGRYRTSTNVGAMGHAATGVVGAAIGRGGPAVAILGDGAMLMMNEVSTAAKRGAHAVWVVLNDGRYNMCHQGMRALGMEGVADASFPAADFALLARALGAEGVRVEREADLEAALAEALAARGPFVVDVVIDAEVAAPSYGRNEGLKATRNSAASAEPVSFPLPQAD